LKVSLRKNPWSKKTDLPVRPQTMIFWPDVIFKLKFRRATESDLSIALVS
jgi:hypothetical protein